MSAAADAAETERMVGQILDDGLAATGYLPGAAGSAGSAPTGQAASAAGSDAGGRALFVLRTLDEVAAPVPMGDTGHADARPVSDNRVIDAMNMAGTTLKVNPFSGNRPTDYAARHQRNLALGEFALMGLVGFFGALLALGDGSGSATTPAASPGASGAAVIAGPSPAPSTVATPDPAVLQSAEPSATASTAPPSSSPAAVTQSVTLRGPIDVRAMTKTGLKVGQHDLELVVFLDNGHVTGSFVIAMEEFPIGALLTGTFGEPNPDYKVFKTCTVRLILDGDATGTYDAGSRKLKGKVAFHSVSEDVRDCLKTRPSNVTIDPDSGVKPTTVTWTGTFDGSRARGTLGLTPELAFTATPED